MKDNEFGLPGRQELPDEVRDRIRRTVNDGMATAPRRRSIRTPLAVAAAVVAVFAGAVVVTQGMTGGEEANLAGPAEQHGPGVEDPQRATATLDRCWAAAQAQGKAGLYPDRAEWKSVFDRVTNLQRSGIDGGAYLVAVRAAGKPVFCETTLTTVTVSDPNATPAYAGDSGTGMLLFSDMGFVAGVVNPAWKEMKLTNRSGRSSSGSGGPVTDGLFAVDVMSNRADTTVEVEDATEAPPHEPMDGVGPGGVEPAKYVLPPAPEPAVSMVDRAMEPAERTSPEGQFLGYCLSKAPPVADPDTYTAGPIVSYPFQAAEVVMARQGDVLLSCYEQDWHTGTEYSVSRPNGAEQPPLQPGEVRAATFDLSAMSGSAGQLYGGLAPANAVRMEVTATLDGTTTSIEAQVANGTFGFVNPNQPLDMAPEGEPKLTLNAKVFDEADNVIYDGVIYQGGD